MTEYSELESVYDPKQVEHRMHELWMKGEYFRSIPDARPPAERFTVAIPPPNVTGALHLGHVLNNSLQDVLVRYHRMLGKNTCWLPGSDHAGIATQAVVEKRIYEEEGKSRHELGREKLVGRIWQWKDQYEKRIITQLQMMGCSCDWDRLRFTLDEGCARAVRHTFFRFFKDGLIFRGTRLINWDTQLQTAVSDDEVYHETVKGHFWHLRYPIKAPGPDDPKWIVLATTRPETMLGDTAVAVHPTDERYKKLVGRTVILPLMNREIPIIADVWADPEKGSGCVKITPAHDFNDYEVGQRQNLAMINILNPDGTINENGGPYAGMDCYEARKKVVADLEAQGLIDKIEDMDIEVGHSDRSKTPIEPFLSEQWFVRMGELAGAAMEAVSDGRVRFTPARYAKTYLDWLGEKRDWCISRQLWWGHRIPIWYCADCSEQDLRSAFGDRADVVWKRDDDKKRWLICSQDEDLSGDAIPGHTLEQDPDVLDTWFSSALWPHSTFGWPEKNADLDYYYPGDVLVTSRDIITNWVCRMVLTGLYNMNEIPFHEVYIHAKILDGYGETMSKSKGNGVDPLDIIETMGADAMRYAIADLATESQDVRMPVEYLCPHCRGLTPQTREMMAKATVKCSKCEKAFATRLANDATIEEHGLALLVSDKFEIGRNFCNKLWNAARFSFMNLQDVKCRPLDLAGLPTEDRWVLACMSQVIREINEAMAEFQFSRAINKARDFFWDALCDWYLELVKYRLREERQAAEAKQVLAFCLDQTLRLFHPFIPFITERLWQQLNAQAADRSLPGLAEIDCGSALVVSRFPPADGWAKLDDQQILDAFGEVQAAVTGVRKIRSDCNVPPKDKIHVTIKVPPERIESLSHEAYIIEQLSGTGDLQIASAAVRPKNAATLVSGDLQIIVHDVIDDAQEQGRMDKELAEVGKLIAGKESKLSNENFVKRAPADVVEAERERLANLVAKREALQENLRMLET